MTRLKHFLFLSILILSTACTGAGGNPTPTPSGANGIIGSITPAPTAAPTDASAATELPTSAESTATPDAPITAETDQPTDDDEWIDYGDLSDLEALPTIDPDSFYQFELDNRGLEFTLTEEEQGIYEKFTSSLDISHLKDVDPVSIAKIHIQAGIDGLWEAEYAMFSERGLSLTKHEFQEVHVYDTITADISSRKPVADVIFPHLKDGVFTETEDGLGVITFLQFNGEEAKFRLVKNDDGIWLCKENPTIPWDFEEQNNPIE